MHLSGLNGSFANSQGACHLCHLKKGKWRWSGEKFVVRVDTTAWRCAKCAANGVRPAADLLDPCVAPVGDSIRRMAGAAERDIGCKHLKKLHLIISYAADNMLLEALLLH